MRHCKKIIAASLFYLFTYQTFAEKPTEIPFGIIPRSDLEMKTFSDDPSAPAMYLLEQQIGELIISNSVSVVLNYHARIKILKQSGLEYANIIIPVGRHMKVSNIEAAVFNLEDEKVVEQKVRRKDIVRYERSANSYEYRIIIPQVKVGSVVEYRYQLTAENYLLPPKFEFQHEIPVRYGEFYYNFSSFLMVKFFVSGDKKLLNIRQFENLSKENYYHFIVHDIPAFYKEPYMPNTEDYLLAVDFELAGFRTTVETKYVTPSYANIHSMLLQEDPIYRDELKKTQFLEKHTKAIVALTDDPVERVKLIHEFVRTHMSSIEFNDIYPLRPLKESFKKGYGNCADINFILIGMLRQAGIVAFPVILSTRSNGKLNPYYCNTYKFNYVVAGAIVNGKTYLIDATSPYRPFDLLPFECLNDSGRSIDINYHKWIKIRNDEKFKSVQHAILQLNADGTLTGKIKNIYYGYDACQARERIGLHKAKGYIALLKSRYPTFNIDSVVLNNVDSVDKPFEEIYSVRIVNGFQLVDSTANNQKFVLINSQFLTRILENEFIDAKRNFPISFGCPMEYKSIITFQLPKNYELYDKNSSVKYLIPQNGGSFDYRIQQNEQSMQIMLDFQLKRYDFPETDYELVRNFFNRVNKKLNELIVLKDNSVGL